MSDRRRVTRTTRGFSARALTCALIFFVTYGATIEVIHQHGPFSPDRASANSIGSTAGGDASSHSQSSGECPICQLHQNLFNGLFHALPDALPLPVILAFISALALSYSFITHTPRRGRAPPVASLL